MNNDSKGLAHIDHAGYALEKNEVTDLMQMREWWRGGNGGAGQPGMAGQPMTAEPTLAEKMQMYQNALKNQTAGGYNVRPNPTANPTYQPSYQQRGQTAPAAAYQAPQNFQNPPQNYQGQAQPNYQNQKQPQAVNYQNQAQPQAVNYQSQAQVSNNYQPPRAAMNTTNPSATFGQGKPTPYQGFDKPMPQFNAENNYNQNYGNQNMGGGDLGGRVIHTSNVKPSNTAPQEVNAMLSQEDMDRDFDARILGNAGYNADGAAYGVARNRANSMGDSHAQRTKKQSFPNVLQAMDDSNNVDPDATRNREPKSHHQKSNSDRGISFGTVDSVKLDQPSDTLTRNRVARRGQSVPSSPSGPNKRKKKKSRKGVMGMVDRALDLKENRPGEKKKNSKGEKKHRRKTSARQKYLQHAGTGGNTRPFHYSDGMIDELSEDYEDSSSDVSMKDLFHDRHNKNLPSSLGLNKHARHRWRDLPVEKQLQLLKNSARREALVAQARLWEAQEKQKLLARLERSENLEFVKKTLASMAKDADDPFLGQVHNESFDQLTHKLIDDEESEENQKIGAKGARRGGRTGRTASKSFQKPIE